MKAIQQPYVDGKRLGKRGRERTKAIQQPRVDGKRLGRPRGRGARSTLEPKIAPVPDFPRNTTGQSTLRCPAQREIRSAAKGSGQRARRRRKSEYPPQARPAKAMA